MFTVVVSDPVVHLDLALSGLGIAILPLYTAKRTDTCSRLSILPLWNPEPITRCALFSGSARLTPKVQVLLDFLGEYLEPIETPGFRVCLRRVCLRRRNSRQRRGPDDCGSC